MQTNVQGSATLYYRDTLEFGNYDEQTPGQVVWHYDPPNYYCTSDIDCDSDNLPEPVDLNPSSSYYCNTGVNECRHEFQEFTIGFQIPERGN